MDLDASGVCCGELVSWIMVGSTPFEAAGVWREEEEPAPRDLDEGLVTASRCLRTFWIERPARGIGKRQGPAAAAPRRPSSTHSAYSGNRRVLLASGGADVIKVEPPSGEPLRRRARPGTSATLPFAMLNQNKRAVTSTSSIRAGASCCSRWCGGPTCCWKISRRARWTISGSAGAVLREINPRLIYATGTGFGISGPDRDNLAMDLTIQAASGIMSVTGAPDGPPMKAGPTLVDFMGGIHLYAGIMTALYDRDRSGEGPPRRNRDAGDRVFLARGKLRILPPHRRAAAARRQPAGRRCRARRTTSIPAPTARSRSMSSPRGTGRT